MNKLGISTIAKDLNPGINKADGKKIDNLQIQAKLIYKK